MQKAVAHPDQRSKSSCEVVIEPYSRDAVHSLDQIAYLLFRPSPRDKTLNTPRAEATEVRLRRFSEAFHQPSFVEEIATWNEWHEFWDSWSEPEFRDLLEDVEYFAKQSRTASPIPRARCFFTIS